MLRETILAIWLVTFAGCATNPVTGRQQLALIPEDRVIDASAEAYTAQITDYRKKGEVEVDTQSVARVKRLANRLIGQAIRLRPETQKWNWEVNVINEPQVNAFAMAGGKIVVYRGLLDQLQPTDDELAQVLAHEIGHAIAGHTREKMSLAMGTELAIATVGAARSSNDKTQQALGAAAMVAIQLPNSRHMESEADRIGIELAAKAGFDPNAAVSLWKKMANLQGGQTPQFLSTHPSDETRIRALTELAPQMMPAYKSARP